MPDRGWDAVVVGIGAVGSAALLHLARRGHRVLGVERFWVPNPRGSSHGRSRMFRVGFPDPDRVPLLLRSRELWRELETISGENLFRTTGHLTVGPAQGKLVERTVEACRQWEVDFDLLSARELSQRHPAFRVPSGHQVVLQPQGGILDPERCVATATRLAESHGAQLRTGLRLREWREGEAGVTLRLEDGEGETEVVECGRLILALGPWSVHGLRLPSGAVTAERQVTGWLRPFSRSLFQPDRFPAFLLEVPQGRYYGFPELTEEGVKVGRFHHLRERVDPDHMDRTVSPGDRKVLREFTEHYFPEGAGEPVRLETCLYTNSRDHEFVVGPLPGAPRVLTATAFGGHGFAFAPVMGEILTDLAVEGSTRHPIEAFRPARLAV